LNCRKDLWKRYLAVAVLIVFVITLAIYGSLHTKQTIRIEGTGQKREESFGTDVRIDSIRVNQRPLTAKDVKRKGAWEVTDSYFCALNADTSTWIEIPFGPGDTVEITFVTQHGSGFAEIEKNREHFDTLDLYSQDILTYKYVANQGGQTAPWRLLMPWLLLAEGLLLEGFGLLWLLGRWKGKETGRKGRTVGLIFAQALMLYIAVETINRNLWNVPLLFALRNVLVYFALMLLVNILCPGPGLAGGIVSAGCLTVSAANYYLTIFRGTPLIPGDFLTLRTAANVAGQYQYRLTGEICAALVLVVLILCISRSFSGSWCLRGRISLGLAAAVLLAVLVQEAGSYKQDLWNLQQNTADYGLGMSLISNACSMRLKKPAGYDPNETERFLDRYAEEQTASRPNIIVVMNEAFSDLSVFCEGLDSEQYMPYFNSLSENTVKGTAVSSVIGGLTANSEYEFLTGNSMYFIKNDVPYQQHIYRDTYSIVGELKDRGYAAVAVHPYAASGYNRPEVYTCFGFDRFLSIEDFSDYELVRNQYVSDRDTYEKVIRVFEEIQQASDPAFIFTITMQNHGDYGTGYFGENVIPLTGMEGQYPEVEEYLTLIKQSDEALPVLLSYFEQVAEPTVVLLFGDHQPNFDDSFYETMFSMNYLNPVQKKFEVPFLIWANYDIPEEQGLCTSLNYLSALLFDRTGISCTPYQNYLLELQQTIPAISKNGYLDPDGSWYAQGKDPQVAEKLEEYWRLMYHHMFKGA